MRKISIIAAMDKNGYIGYNNGIPWHEPIDLQHFKTETLHKIIVMGRKTFESLHSIPLKDRINIVLTKNPCYKKGQSIEYDNLYFIHEKMELPQILNLYTNISDIYIIGGAQIYNLFLPIADQLILTELFDSYEGDVKFPDVDWIEWKCYKEKKYNSFTIKYYNRQIISDILVF